ncbi:MAG TPA: YdeI/OmpD-associated family protein [Flavisolibacter sp.]|jgi:hypothetical protein|nr:YdeI/OmpD-associated family protein [Flavisolibacter sp.]
MATALAQKLKIKEGATLLTLHAPNEFATTIGDLPKGVNISNKAKNYNQVHWFVKTAAQMEEEVDGVLNLLQEDVLLWTYFPKGTSGIQTDLTRDTSWEKLHMHSNIQFLVLISFNETWSAFALRLKTEKDKKKVASPKERPVFQYIDPVKKLVFLPDDLAAALNGAKREKAFFESLSFTNKKEYLEWVVSAKREETRAGRVKETVERLGKGWKNPANR